MELVAFFAPLALGFSLLLAGEPDDPRWGGRRGRLWIAAGLAFVLGPVLGTLLGFLMWLLLLAAQVLMVIVVLVTLDHRRREPGSFL
jgi:hypothetical protein